MMDVLIPKQPLPFKFDTGVPMGKFRAIVALSGGLDSATLLAFLLHTRGGPGETLAVGFDYGSRHANAEQAAAVHIAAHYNVKRIHIPLYTVATQLYFPKELESANLPQASKLLQGALGPIPEGHYQEENMKQTVVPGRNLLFISLMAAMAEAQGVEEIYIGAHAGDHYIYPDCRPDFLLTVRSAIRLSTENKVKLLMPFSSMDKKAIVAQGIELGVPFQMTRTCYTSHKVACGKCGSCQERLEAFAKCGSEDPLEYTSRELLPKSETAQPTR